MDGFDWFALAAGCSAIASAIWAGVQGRAARRQARAAEAQTAISVAQLEEMRKANDHAAKTREEEREAKRLKLDLTARKVKDGDHWWLEVMVENNSELIANIQEAAAVFNNGGRYTKALFSGDIELTKGPRHKEWLLPGRLKPKAACTFRFGTLDSKTHTSPGVIGFYSENTPPDYEDPQWRGLESVELRANNTTFFVPEGDGTWRRQFVHGWSSTYSQSNSPQR